MICKREFDLVATWLSGLQESCTNVQQLLMACLQPISLLFFDIPRVFLPRFVNVLWSFAALGIYLIYFEFLATLITENALVKSRDMLSGWMCFIEFQLQSRPQSEFVALPLLWDTRGRLAI